MRLSIPQWNLLSRVVFRLFSSGADVSSRPDPIFEGNSLILNFETAFMFGAFSRMSLQYEAGNTVLFITEVTSGTTIVSTCLFNSTPVVNSLSDMTDLLSNRD